MRPYVIAHRGTSGRYPENTLVAFEHAVAVGADWIEFDVHTTADGVVIVSHDNTADRCTDGRGSWKTKTLAQVKQLDAGSWFDDSFAGTRIPTLEEAFDLLGDGRVRLCIEIKGEETGDYLRTAWGTVQVLQKRGLFRQAMVASFNHECLRAVKMWQPLLATSLDPTPQDGTCTPWELCQQALRCSAAMQHCFETLTPDLIEEAHGHGFSLWTWTVNDPADMRRMIAIGVDAIMSDYPDVLRAVVDEKM